MKTKEKTLPLTEMETPISEYLIPVNFQDELNEAQNNCGRFVKKERLMENLEWLQESGINTLYYRPGGSRKFVYLFELDEKICEFSAASLKIRFPKRKKWSSFAQNNILLDLLSNKKKREIERELKEETIVEFSIEERKFPERRATEAQISYIYSLLERNQYEFDYEILEDISMDTASRLIPLLRAFKPIKFFHLNEFIEEEEDRILDRINYFKKINQK